jgi:hypothetical protein
VQGRGNRHPHPGIRAELLRDAGRAARPLLAEGRTSLVIGLGFLAATLALGRLLPPEAAWSGYVREGLQICGWVGMWRPIEIHLYRWWPIRREAELHRRLARAPVEVVVEA